MSKPVFTKHKAMIADIASALSIGVVFMFLVWMGWLKWTDLQLDFGAELYVPWQIHEGAVLYRDLASFKGPFSPYLNALWFDLFGVSLHTLVWANLGILAMLTAGLTAFVRRCTDRITATIAAIVFLIEHGLPDIMGNNMNFVTPFVHELTHGIALSIFLLLVLVRFMQRPTILTSVSAGLLLGCILLTRIEVGLAALAVVAAAIILSTRLHPLSAVIRTSGMLIIAALIPPVIALGLLSQYMPWPQALSGILGTWKDIFTTPVASTYFFMKVSGFYAPWIGVCASAASVSGSSARPTLFSTPASIS